MISEVNKNTGPYFDSEENYYYADKLKQLIPKNTENWNKEIERFNKIIKIFSQLEYQEKNISISSLQLFDELSEFHEILIKKNYPDINIFKKIFNHYVSMINNHKATCIEWINKLKNQEFFIKEIVDKWLDFGFLDYLIYTNEDVLVSKIMSLKSSHEFKTNFSHANQLIFGLFLDKLLLPKSKYIGFSSSLTIYTLKRAIEHLLNDRSMQPQEKKILENLQKNLFSKNQEFTIASEEVRDWPKDYFAGRVVNKLTAMQPKDNLMISTGNRKHHTLLLVTFEENLTYSLTHYNTGAGTIDWHAQWGNTNRYQTFWKIENIDQSSITDLDAWQEIHQLTNIANEMNKLYICLRDRLGKTGTLQPSSVHQEDYEAKQASGTCACQCWMAVIRHQIMSLALNHPMIAEAIYKSIKTKLFRVYQTQYSHQLDQTIQTHSKTIFEKFSSEEALIELASHFDSYLHAIKEFSLIGKIEIEKLPLLDRNSTLFERYANLRAASNLLFAYFSTHSQALPLEIDRSNTFSLALAKLTHRQAILKNIKISLDESETQSNFDELAFECKRVLLSTSFFEEGIQEVVNRMGNEQPTDKQDPPAMKNFLDLMTQGPHSKKTALIIMSLSHKIASSGNPSLAEWIKVYWDKTSPLLSLSF